MGEGLLTGQVHSHGALRRSRSHRVQVQLIRLVPCHTYGEENKRRVNSAHRTVRAAKSTPWKPAKHSCSESPEHGACCSVSSHKMGL